MASGLDTVKWIFYGIFAVLVLIFLVIRGCSTIIDAGHTGVVRRLGAIQPKALPEGLSFVTPFITDVTEIDTRLRSLQKRIEASSNDLQTVYVIIAVQYSLKPDMTPKLIQKIGTRDVVHLKILIPAIKEVAKTVVSKYTSKQLVSKRALVKSQIRQRSIKAISDILKSKEVDGSIEVANVAIMDFAFSSEFRRAVDSKVRAKQLALQAKSEKIRRVTQAEAASAKRKLESEAEAYRIQVVSKAKAAAMEMEAEALKASTGFIEFKMAEKWNGVVPVGRGRRPIFRIDASKFYNTND